MKGILLFLVLCLFISAPSFADLCKMKKETGLYELYYSGVKKGLVYVEKVADTQNVVMVSIVHEFKLTQDGKLPEGITSEMVVNNFDKSLKRLVRYEVSDHLVIFQKPELSCEKQVKSGFPMGRRGLAASQAGEYYLVILKEKDNECLKTIFNPLYPRTNDDVNRYQDITPFEFIEVE